MSRPITLFSGYSQRENRTTNYCLLVLKMLYEENPKFLAEVLSTLVGEELGGRIGVKFSQQEKKSTSVPDGLIVQPPFTIYIESKNFDWFYDAQLERHLAALDEETPGFKVLLALSPTEGEESDRFTKIRTICEEKYQRTIAFEKVSFEDLIEAIPIDRLPKNLADAVTDFRAYLEEQNLLPSWKRWLDVVNCAGYPDDVLVDNVYMCPATGGPYNHWRCKYFGMYRYKRVEKIAIIEAVIDVEDDQRGAIKWSNIDESQVNLIGRACAKSHQRRRPTRVFLLGTLYDTDFRKDTPGGMYGSKQYFDVGALNAPDAQALALALHGKTWSELRAQGGA